MLATKTACKCILETYEPGAASITHEKIVQRQRCTAKCIYLAANLINEEISAHFLTLSERMLDGFKVKATTQKVKIKAFCFMYLFLLCF